MNASPDYTIYTKHAVRDISDSIKHDNLYTGASEPLKAGILPFHTNEKGDIEFLIASPVAKKEPGLELPFGMCRGSRSIKNSHGEWMDYKDQASLDRDRELIVPAHATAIKEATEELGLLLNNIGKVYDFNRWEYNDYGIHTFLAEVKDSTKHAKSTDDSRVITWETLDSIKQMEQAGNFKSGYVPIIEAANDYISQSKHMSAPPRETASYTR